MLSSALNHIVSSPFREGLASMRTAVICALLGQLLIPAQAGRTQYISYNLHFESTFYNILRL